MKKILRFVARHLVVSFFTIILSLLAVIGSAYGFLQVADATYSGSVIPQVKTVEEFEKELEQNDPKPTPVPRKDSIIPPSVVPSQNPGNTGTASQIISPVVQNNSNNNSPVTVTPRFEKDEEIEDIDEDEGQEIHKAEEKETEEK